MTFLTLIACGLIAVFCVAAVWSHKFADTLAQRVVPGGFWHLATDWPDYALAIEDAVTTCPRWDGGVITRPEWRPLTRYERRGRAAGREPIDLWFERVDA